MNPATRNPATRNPATRNPATRNPATRLAASCPPSETSARPASWSPEPEASATSQGRGAPCPQRDRLRPIREILVDVLAQYDLALPTG